MPPDTLLFAAPATLGAALAAGLFGLLIGSFLNVVIHRLPRMMQRETDNCVAVELDKEMPHTDTYNLMVPRSACPHCGHQITALENIPVVSYLVLGGKCSSCKAPISVRYPLIEAFTGLLSAAVVWTFGSDVTGLAVLLFTYFLIAMTFIDFDTKMLPDDLTLPLMWAGLLFNLNGGFVPLRDAVIGAAAGYMVLWSVNYLYRLVRGHDGMGYGDFKLLAALGAWMGWAKLPVIILLSSVVGSIVGLSLILFFRHAKDKHIPFGPYLAGAGMLAMMYAPQLASYTRAFGF
ncbi:MAG: A24 family peptidase [Pseudomonadota bacterium]